MSSAIPELCRLRSHQRARKLLLDLAMDIQRYAQNSFESGQAQGLLRSISALLTPSVSSVALHRVSHFVHANGWRRLASMISFANTVVHKTTITPSSCIDAGLFLPHPTCLVFHGRAGSCLTLYANVVCSPLGPISSSPVEAGPCFGDRVSVGVHAAVLGAVRVGDDARIGFSVVLREDAAARTIVVPRRTSLRRHEPVPRTSR